MFYLSLLLHRLPHPVTIAGMLEMGSAYLPVNSRWDRYVHEAQMSFDQHQREAQQALMRLADDACMLARDDRYKCKHSYTCNSMPFFADRPLRLGR